MVRKINFTMLVFALSIFMANGQKYSKEFGKIGQSEVDLKEYALDKDAEAVVLFDIGKSRFEQTENFFDIVFEKATRIKILSEAGIKWAEIEIPFAKEGDIYEKVYDIEAVSYNFENGNLNKTILDASNIYDEKINEYWKVKKFAIPNVKVGSIIEYRYKIKSKNKFNLRDWEFQWKIPVVYSEYITKMIPFLEYTFMLQGSNKFDIQESYEDKGIPRYYGPPRGTNGDNSFYDMVYKFGMKNVPAFGDEEFITSINDYIIKVDFQLSKIYRMNGSSTEFISTWEELAKDLLKNWDFGKYISKSKKMASKLLNIKELSKKSKEERFNAILDYVKNNYNWNYTYGKFATKKPKELIKDKIGNCADINLFTIGLLQKVGIDAYPVILSTRGHGKIRTNYPFSHYFNYVVILAEFDDRVVLSDATEVLNRNDRIPPRCLNDKGLIVKKGDVNWAVLDCQFKSEATTYMQMDIKKNNIAVDLLKMGTGYEGMFLRKIYGDDIKKIKKKVAINNYIVDQASIKVKNYLDKTKSYRLRYSFTTTPEIVNSKIYISPFLHEPITVNPLKQKERKYPIDMIYPKKQVYNTTITLPEGYQIDFIPENLKINNELFELNYSTEKYNDNLQIVFYYYFKKPIYSSENYSKIKSYFDQIVKKGNEKIVLKKSD